MKYYEKLNTLKGDFLNCIENKEIENDKLLEELITFATSKTLTQVRHVIGSAGTGKSTLLINLIKHLKLNSQLDIKVITPTNAARDVLVCGLIRSGLGDEVYTIVMTADSYLYNSTCMGKDDDGKSIYDKTAKRILSPDLLIIDEFSLFPSVDWQLCCSLDCKIITVGDPKQLPAVADSIDCFCSVYNTSTYHYKLTTNYRQDNEQLKNRIAELENTNRINLDNGSIDDICTMLATKGNSLENMTEYQGITITNTSCKQYNKHVKKILLQNSQDFIKTLGMTEKVTVNNVIVPNEVIVFRHNDKRRGIYNGNIFRVLDVKRIKSKNGYKWKADLENSNGWVVKKYDISTLLNPSLNADCCDILNLYQRLRK